MTITLPLNVKIIIESLTQAGYEAYAVGGCVRDSILLEKPNDWDITTSAKPEEIKAIFRRTVDTGIEHGTVSILLDDQAYEVTTYRIDGKYRDARHPEAVTFTGDLREDLLRRDFTINAMAYNEQSGIVDLYNGQEDLKEGVIRCVGDPMERFGEDALRMMRAVRFSAKLGFAIEDKTKAAITTLAPNLAKVSAERVQIELVKLLISDHPDRFQVFDETGLTAIFLPEFAKLDQQERQEVYSSLQQVPKDKNLRLAVLLYRVVDEDHQNTVGQIMRRLKFDNDTRKKVVVLTRYAKILPNLSMDHGKNLVEMRKQIVEIGQEAFPAIFSLQEAISPYEQTLYGRETKICRRLYEEIIRREDPLSIKDLAVNGSDLQAIGVTEGIRIGAILQELFHQVISNPDQNTKENLLKWTKQNLLIFALIVIVGASLVGCSGFEGAQPSNANQLENQEVQLSKLDGEFVVMEKRTQSEQLVISKVGETDKRVAYNYGGYTTVENRYGKNLTMGEVEAGMVVNITLEANEHKVQKLELSQEAWKVEGATGWTLDSDLGYSAIGNRKAQWTEKSLCFKGGELVDIGQVSSADTVDVYGVENQVVSVIVKKSHGTLTISGLENSIGGYLIIGNQVATEVVQDKMELEIPEGNYLMNLYYKGVNRSTEVVVVSGENLEIKDEKLVLQEAKICQVTFVPVQKNMVIYVGGTKVDVSKPLTLAKGAYGIQVEAPGYETINKILMINAKEATITVDLEVLSQLSDEASDGDTTQDANSADEGDKTEGDTTDEQDPNSQLEEEHSPSNHVDGGSTDGTTEDENLGDTDEDTTTEDTSSAVDQIIDAILGGN